ncbi:sulfite exporter TauE/SafE family protein [Natrinema gelatinilyticum]|uniref:urease accessory protein UreH domain-containing protein n=1 Tax=Natrinema gelatinilyticum TaxID=2961571 RepID=UPI0020C282E7|nr:sulfite exporter TauE/SafE family protein [Natrinema gelatinilyticum]
MQGGLALGVLGLGTIPTLLAYGTVLGTVSAKRRASLHRGLGTTFLLLGHISVTHELILLGFDIPHFDVPFYQPLA